MGRAAQYAGDEPVRRWRAAGVETLCVVGRLYRPDVGLLRGLPLRREAACRPRRLSVQRALLGFPCPQPWQARQQSAHGDAVPDMGQDGRGSATGVAGTGRGFWRRSTPCHGTGGEGALSRWRGARRLRYPRSVGGSAAGRESPPQRGNAAAIEAASGVVGRPISRDSASPSWNSAPPAAATSKLASAEASGWGRPAPASAAA